VAALQDAVEVLGADRPVAVGRELTKKFEEVVRGTAGEVLARFERQAPRGEITVLIGPTERRRGRRGDDEERRS
jgi:16S rRNA (cytidine1402-2'-O)-methyltransferase